MLALKTTASREGWGDGPWRDEPDSLAWNDDATGLPCLLMRGPLGHWCGYVAVDPMHPFHGRDLSSEPLSDVSHAVHGGITYSGRIDGTEPGRMVWWLGFDCAHFGDASPWEIGGRGAGVDRYRTAEYARRECTKLAAAVRAAGGNGPWR